MTSYKWPLMKSQFTNEDAWSVVRLLVDDEDQVRPEVRLTQGPQVKAFEEEFSQWLGVKHAVMVNSGSSANLLTMAALRERRGGKHLVASFGKVLVPCVTWASDITSVLHAGFEPVFVDIDRRTLGMDGERVWKETTEHDHAAVFVTHCMGYNAFDGWARGANNVCCDTPLFEDCCEGPGAKYGSKKVGTVGFASNYSFYYAHHMTTIEGGMVCTDDEDFAQVVRCLRGHGLLREAQGDKFNPNAPIIQFDTANPDDKGVEDLEPQFAFMLAGYNCRSTEINAVIGRSQLKRLDEGIEQRRELLQLFLSLLDPDLYQTDFAVEGSSPYALTLVLRNNDEQLRSRVAGLLAGMGVETRRGIAGGGNQLRQPYLRRRYGTMYAEFPNAEHVHWNGYAIGLWPSLEPVEIKWLCEKLNGLKA